MSRFAALKAFIIVAKEGSFTRAAEQLQVSRAAVSKQIMQLEEGLNARLLDRTTRSVTLTDVGREYFERVEQILADLEEADMIVNERHSSHTGILRIGAPVNFGALHLGSGISAFLKTYPFMGIELFLCDSPADPLVQEVDIGVVIGLKKNPKLVCRLLHISDRVVCASPDYLRHHGVPHEPEDLRNHRCLSHRNLDNPKEWSFEGPQASRTVKVNGPLVTSNGDALRAATLAGLGIAHGPYYVFEEDINRGRLRIVLGNFRVPSAEVYSTYAADHRAGSKIETFLDFMETYFMAHPLPRIGVPERRGAAD